MVAVGLGWGDWGDLVCGNALVKSCEVKDIDKDG